MKRRGLLIAVYGLILPWSLGFLGCSIARYYVAAEYGIGVSKDRWVGVYQLPNETQVGAVISDFHKFADSIEATCFFKNETRSFEGTAHLKGKIKDGTANMVGMISDPIQGSTVISIQGYIRNDIMEGSFCQQAANSNSCGVFLLVRLTHTTYIGGITRHQITETGKTLIDIGVSSEGLLGPGRADAYGPGIHSDATGRPFVWRTNEGQMTFGPVKENAYGLGVGMDQFGRPVRTKPLW